MYMCVGGKGCILIKTALSNILVYYMPVFFSIPVKVAKQIKSLQRSFLSEGKRSRRDHLIKWEEVCKPKNDGGLGIRNLLLKNQALLGKWLWRFVLEEESLWHSLKSNKYGLVSNGGIPIMYSTQDPL